MFSQYGHHSVLDFLTKPILVVFYGENFELELIKRKIFYESGTRIVYIK